MKINIKSLIIIVDIIVLLAFTFICVRWYMNNENFEFKKFSFNIPKGMEAKIVSEDQFTLTGNKIDAEVEIFIDSIKEIFTQDMTYSALFHDNNIEVYPPIKDMINDKEIMCFQKVNEPEMICFYDAFDDFAYEILLKNNMTREAMETVMDVLDTAKYDYKSDKKYEYYEQYEKLVDAISK